MQPWSHRGSWCALCNGRLSNRTPGTVRSCQGSLDRYCSFAKELSSLQMATKLIYHFHSPAAESQGEKVVVLQGCLPEDQNQGPQTQAGEQLAAQMMLAG